VRVCARDAYTIFENIIYRGGEGRGGECVRSEGRSAFCGPAVEAMKHQFQPKPTKV